MDRNQLARYVEMGKGNPLQAERAINMIAQEISAGRNDYLDRVAASEQCIVDTTDTYGHPALGGNTIQPMIAPDRLIVVPTATVAAATTGLAVQINFSSGSGYIVGMRGSVINPATGAAFALEAIEVSFNFNGGEELITDGNVVRRASFANLFAGVPNFMPFQRRVTSKDRMNFTFANLDAATALLPSLTLAFRRTYDSIGR